MKINQGMFDVLRAMPVFKPEMRKANRDRLKSQTRRVADQDFRMQKAVRVVANAKADCFDFIFADETGMLRKCPYGKAGDLVYMREPLFKGPFDIAHYLDTKTVAFHALTGEPIKWRWNKDTLSGMFMPKEAACSFYRYEFIRVELVQDITEEDARAEGVAAYTFAKGVLADNPPDPRWKYIHLWNEINEKRGFGWDVNPWVWVLGYKPVEMRDAI